LDQLVSGVLGEIQAGQQVGLEPAQLRDRAVDLRRDAAEERGDRQVQRLPRFIAGEDVRDMRDINGFVVPAPPVSTITTRGNAEG